MWILTILTFYSTEKLDQDGGHAYCQMMDVSAEYKFLDEIEDVVEPVETESLKMSRIPNLHPCCPGYELNLNKNIVVKAFKIPRFNCSYRAEI